MAIFNQFQRTFKCFDGSQMFQRLEDYFPPFEFIRWFGSAKRQHSRAFRSISVGIFRLFSTFYEFLLFSSGIAEININLALLDPVCFTKVCLVILKCMERSIKWVIKGFSAGTHFWKSFGNIVWWLIRDLNGDEYTSVELMGTR